MTCATEIIALARVLVDTSVWIEFFRGREPYHGGVLKLLDSDQTCCMGIIMGELMQGAKSDRELSVIADFIHVFQFLPESPKLWEMAGRLSFSLRRKGLTIGLADCFIAVSAKEAGASIFSLDSHFEAIAGSLEIELYSM